MQRFATQIGLFVALLAGNAIILFDPWSGEFPRLLAAIILPYLLPGWAWLPVLGWMRTNRALERIVLVFGCSSLLTATALLFLVFAPGPFTEMPTLIVTDLIILIGLITQLIQKFRFTSNLQSLPLEWPPRTVLLILLAILAVAAFTRLTRMGYAEFHEDELENMRFIVRAYKGEEYAPFLDSKGPIHWLVPAAVWYLNGWMNEGIARTPFAITGLLLIPLIYALGRRMSGGRDSMGLLSAGFVALNGFYVAYARHVENQVLIVFWGALAMWFVYRYYSEEIDHFLIYVGFTLAIGLIAHPDVVLYLPVFAYVIWRRLWGRPDRWRREWPWLVSSGLLFTGLVAYFYIPYLFDPEIGLVYQYFAGDRIGVSYLYNRVHNMFDQDQLYASRYHAPVLVFLLGWLLARQFAQWGWPGLLIFGTLCLAIVATVSRPGWWIAGDLINLAFVPYALLVLMVISLPRTDFETKTIFLWFSVPLGTLMFMAKDAADHIQVAYTGWALLSAFALSDLWRFLDRPDFSTTPPTLALSQPTKPDPRSSWPSDLTRALKAGLVVTLTLIVGLILFYQYLAFSVTVIAYWQAKIDSATHPDSIYNRLYGSIPRPRKIFSNPRLGGWKTVGYLRETGAISGDFRSMQESFVAPIWYTFQTPRSCYEDPQHMWVRRGWQGWPDEEQDLVGQGYSLTRIILVDQEPKLHLYEKEVSVDRPEIIDSEVYRPLFDRLASPARFAREETGRTPTAVNFGGDRLRLLGYDFPDNSFEAGELIRVAVYWETLAPMATRYRAFMHLVDENGGLWGQHDDDPACRLLTTDMRPGQRSSRQFRLPIDPQTPPGHYTIILGLYNPDTLERLEIWDAGAEQNVGDHLVLGQITIAGSIDLTAK